MSHSCRTGKSITSSHAPSEAGISQRREHKMKLCFRSSTPRVSDESGKIFAVVRGGGLLKFRTRTERAVPQEFRDGHVFFPQDEIGRDMVSAKTLKAYRDLYIETAVETRLWLRGKDLIDGAATQAKGWRGLGEATLQSMSATVNALLIAQKTDFYSALSAEIQLARRLDDLEGLREALTVWAQDDKAKSGAKSCSPISNKRMTALAIDIKKGKEITSEQREALMEQTGWYFEDKMVLVARYERLPTGSVLPLRWAPLMTSQKCCGEMSSAEVETLPDWGLLRKPQGELTAGPLVDESLVDSYLPRVTITGDHSIFRDRVLPIFKAYMDELDAVRSTISRLENLREPFELPDELPLQLYQHLTQTLECYDDEETSCVRLWVERFGAQKDALAAEGRILTPTQQCAWDHMCARTFLNELSAAQKGRELIKLLVKELGPTDRWGQDAMLNEAEQATADDMQAGTERRLEAAVSGDLPARYLDPTYTLEMLVSELRDGGPTHARQGRDSGNSSQTMVGDAVPGGIHLKLDASSHLKGEVGAGHGQVGIQGRQAPGSDRGVAGLSVSWYSGAELNLAGTEPNPHDLFEALSEPITRHKRLVTGASMFKEDPFDWADAGTNIQPTHAGLASISFGDFNSRDDFRKTDVYCEAENVEGSTYPAAWGRE